MTNLLSRRQFFRTTVLGGLAGSACGCGTILYPERRGQAKGPLDWKIVGMDAVGLLFFFVPGVIAFAVDFNNGSIYLPTENYGDQPGSPPDRQLTSLRIPREDLTDGGIEAPVSTRLNRNVRLVAGRYQTRKLDSLDDFWTTQSEFAAETPESLREWSAEKLAS